MPRRLTEELDNQQVASNQHTHRLASVISALDELQERRELSDSGKGRLRGILSAPLEQFPGVLGGSAGGLPPRSSGLIRQSSRLSGAVADPDFFSFFSSAFPLPLHRPVLLPPLFVFYFLLFLFSSLLLLVLLLIALLLLPWLGFIFREGGCQEQGAPSVSK